MTKYHLNRICFGTAALMCLWVTGTAQHDVSNEPHSLKHSLGLNTIGLISQIFDNDSNSDVNRYLITYNLDLDKLGIRAAIGPDYSSETTTHEGFTDSEEINFLRVDARIGAGFYFLDDARWSALAGVDVAYHYLRDRTIEDSGFDRITDQIETKSFGGGPFVQLSYNLSRRISLSAESSLYWMHGKTEHVELYKNFPDFNTVLSETTSDGLDLALPSTIYLRIHF